MARSYPLPVALLATLVVAQLSTGCGGQLVSDKDEVTIGKSVDQQIEGEYKIVHPNDPVAQWAVDLVKRLEDGSTKFRDPQVFGGYKVEVIADDKLVNAFAAPGGYTYLSTGLILQATTCAEIAGVMGHELAHVTQRHGAKKVEQAYGAAIVTQLLIGGLAGSIAQGVHSLLLNTAWSQEAESESDTVGLQIAFNAGYNPYGLVDFFEKLLVLKDGKEPPSFLSSHPATAERVAEVDQEIQDRYGALVVRGESQAYHCIGTKMQLDGVQNHIKSGKLQIR